MAAEQPNAQPLIQETASSLSVVPEGDAIERDCSTTSLSLHRHPLALLRARLRYDDTRTLARAPSGRRVRIPGPVPMRQQPMTAEAVIFVIVEDEWSLTANVVAYTHIAERDRVTLLTSGLMIVEGRVEREGQYAEMPIVHLIASRRLEWADEAKRPEAGVKAGPDARARDFRSPRESICAEEG